MNSRKRARSSLQSSHNLEENSTLKNESKRNLLSSCRRVGLNRKKNKPFNTSQTCSDTINKNSFEGENLKNISNEAEISDINSEYLTSNTKPNSKNLGVISSRKRKVENDVSESKETNINTTRSTVNSILENSSVLESSLITKNSKEDKEIKPATNLTIPISINLTRCDLNALKLKLLSSKKTKSNVATENKENLPTTENSQINDNNLSIDNIEIEANHTGTKTKNDNVADKQSEIVTENSSSLLCNENVSIEENSDGSDFYPEVRRKKKKVLTNKQRNISKPNPAQQKENLIKRTSANNTPYSDSDDDFVATPVRRDRKSSVKSEKSQNLEKDEKVKKKKLKINKLTEGELVKTGHIRLSENKSYTIIQRDNYVSYVKSFDNDVNFKITESDDNQQLPVRNTINSPKKTMIVERKDYITKRRNSLVNNIELLMEMPSVFTDLDDADIISVQSQNTPNEENEVTNNSKFVETLKSQKNESEMICNKQNEHQIISEEPKNIVINDNKQHSNSESKMNMSESISSTSTHADEIISDQNKTASKTTTPEIISGPSGYQTNKPTEKCTNKVVAEIIEEFNSESSENEESSDLPESDDDNISTCSKSSDTISKLELQNQELHDMSAKQLSDEVSALESSIKKKEERLQSLQRISVYKETHNLEQLREVTLQIKRGCQNALVDLVLSLKEQSSAEFTMTTLLEYMKIPNELVGYNEQEDKFI